MALNGLQGVEVVGCESLDQVVFHLAGGRREVTAAAGYLSDL